MKTFILGSLGLLFVLAWAPFIFAIECENVDDYNIDTCKKIKNSDLTEKEKESLISNLGYEKKYFPDHDFIYEKNTGLNIKNPPKNVNAKDSKYIKNYWQDIFTAMPSVKYKGGLYVPKKTEVLTGFNYNVKIPNDFKANNHHYKIKGDCKRTHKLVKNKAKNKVYVDGNYQGKGKLTEVNINSDSEIKSVFNIKTKVKIKHYDWEKHCDDWDKDCDEYCDDWDYDWDEEEWECDDWDRDCDYYCDDWDYDCEYENSETKTDKVKLVDKLKVKEYSNNLYAKLKAINSYNDNTKIKTNFSDSVKVDFKNSKYEFNKYRYSIDYSKAPYYILNLKAEKTNKTSIDNLFKSKNNLIVKNTKNCKIKAFDFFNVIEKPCNLNYEKTDFYIETGKLKYKPNETINVKVHPEDISVNLTYNNITKTVKGEAKFKADPPENKIKAQFKHLTNEKVIYSRKKNRFKTLWNISIFGFLNYFAYIVIKKYSGGFI